MKQKMSEKKAEPAPPISTPGVPRSELSSALGLGAAMLIGTFFAVRPLSQLTPYSCEAAISGLVVVLFMLCVGGTLLNNRDRAVAPRDLSVLLTALALWVGLFLIGVIRSPNLGTGIPAATNACVYGGLLLAGFCLTRSEPRLAGIAIRLLIAMIAVEAFSGIWQYKVDLPRIRQMVAANEIELPPDLQSGAGIARLGGDRIFATFGNPNSLAGYLLLGIFLLAGIFYEARRNVTRIAAGVVFLLVAAALVLTGSKGGALAALAGAWFFGAQVIAQRNPNLKRPLIAITAIALALAVGLLAAGFAGYLGPRPFGLSLEVRFDYWRAAAQMWRAHPLNGVGLGGFAENYLYFKTPLGTEVKDAHNDYVQLGTELGIMGPIAYVLLWWLVLKPATESRAQVATFIPDARAALIENCAILGGALGLIMMMAGFLAFNAGDVAAILSGKFDRGALLGAIEALSLPPIFVCVVIALRPAADAPPVPPGWIHGARAAIGAVLVHQLVDFDFRCEATMTAIFVLGGILWGTRSLQTASASMTSEQPATLRPAGIVLAILALLLIPTAAWIPIQSGSARTVAEGLESEVQDLLKKPNSASKNDYQKLRRDIVEERKRARDSAPFDPDTWSELALACEASPDALLPATQKTALLCFERSEKLRPFSPVPKWMLGNYYMHHAFLELAQNDSQAAKPLFESARKWNAAASERYPYCPGIRLWQGDAALMMGDENEAGRLYAGALFIDSQIDDSNVRLAAIFNDPRPGAFSRHNFEPQLLRNIESLLIQENRRPALDQPVIQSGWLLRRMVALAWMIRQNETTHALNATAINDKRRDLIQTGEMLINVTPEMSDRAHAAWLWALSFQMANEKDAPRAKEAWDIARNLQKDSIKNGRPGTPPYTFESMDTFVNRPK